MTLSRTKTANSCARDGKMTLSRTKTANPCARNGKTTHWRTKMANLCAGDEKRAPLRTKTTDSCAKDRETTLSRTKTANPCAREGKKANLRTKTAYLCAKDNHHARKAKAGGKQREGSQNEGQTKRVTNDRHNEKPRDSGETRGLLISDGEGRPEGAERVGSGPEQACGQGHFKTLSSSRRRAFSPSTLRSTILPSRMR